MRSRTTGLDIARIRLCDVWDEGFRHRQTFGYYPYCRAPHCWVSPHWNVRFEYKNVRSRGGGQSMHWCNEHLPEKYRQVADSMRRGQELHRVIKGEALEKVTPRSARTPPAVAAALRAG